MIYKFDHIRDNLITELKAKYLDAQIEVERLTQELARPKTMTKAQIEENLGNWQKHTLDLEKKIQRYKDYDLEKIKEFDYE